MNKGKLFIVVVGGTMDENCKGAIWMCIKEKPDHHSDFEYICGNDKQCIGICLNKTFPHCFANLLRFKKTHPCSKLIRIEENTPE